VFELKAGFKVNSWIRIRTAALTGNTYRGVSVEQDLNTVINEQPAHGFSPDALKSFFEAATEELDTVLNLYFPPATRTG
jgi:hypothetical protein